MRTETQDVAVNHAGSLSGDDMEFWIICAACGQRFDKRHAQEVLHHDAAGHLPLADVVVAPKSAAEKFIDVFTHPAGPADVSHNPPSALPRHQ